jgi:putative Ca2+/H+ antiporter (TMEM165/GDT1 family)
MEIKTALVVFSVVFVAELGDKTQLATLLFSSDQSASKLTVFISASLALVLSVAIAVLAGKYVSEYISETTLRYIAGVGFLAIGAWTLFTAQSVA